MTRKSDPKFEEQLTLGFKSDMTNLINFDLVKCIAKKYLPKL